MHTSRRRSGAPIMPHVNYDHSAVTPSVDVDPAIRSLDPDVVAALEACQPGQEALDAASAACAEVADLKATEAHKIADAARKGKPVSANPPEYWVAMESERERVKRRRAAELVTMVSAYEDALFASEAIAAALTDRLATENEDESAAVADAHAKSLRKRATADLLQKMTHQRAYKAGGTRAGDDVGRDFKDAPKRARSFTKPEEAEQAWAVIRSAAESFPIDAYRSRLGNQRRDFRTALLDVLARTSVGMS